MAKLIMCKGLPASGKSTWAKEKVLNSNGKIKRINKDDLRAMIDAGQWSKGREKDILTMRDVTITTWLLSGLDVIVDDTNLAPKHETRLKRIAKEYDAEFVIKDFTDVPVFECIRRDALREKSVGSKVIVRFYEQFMFDRTTWIKPIKFGSNAILCDLDGTLAIHQGRSPYDLSKVSEDGFNYHLWDLIKDKNIIFLSGREGTEQCRTDTIEWLVKHTGITNSEFYMSNLFMREAGDTRNDSIIKAEIYDTIIEPHYNIISVFDDRDRIVDMWRSKGLFCMQVNYGSF